MKGFKKNSDIPNKQVVESWIKSIMKTKNKQTT